MSMGRTLGATGGGQPGLTHQVLVHRGGAETPCRNGPHDQQQSASGNTGRKRAWRVGHVVTVSGDIAPVIKIDPGPIVQASGSRPGGIRCRKHEDGGKALRSGRWPTDITHGFLFESHDAGHTTVLTEELYSRCGPEASMPANM